MEALHSLPASQTALLDILRLPLAIADAEAPDQPLVFINQAFEALTGYSREEVLGKNCRLLQSSNVCSTDATTMREAIQEGRAVTLTLLNYRKDGTAFWNELTLTPFVGHDGHAYIIAAQRDVSQHKQAHQHMELAQAVFDNSHDGIMVTDASKVIIDTNPAFTRLTGYSREEIIGHKPSLLSSGKHDQQFYLDMFDAVAKHGFWSGDIWNTRKDGSQLIEHTTISAIHDEQSEVINYIGVFRDITSRRLNQARLERMATMDALTGLYNREHFSTLLREQLRNQQFSSTGMAVLFLDMDDFKPINDTHGHAVGDEVLVEIGHRLRRAIRTTDLVSRFGGDEFVIALAGIGSVAKALKVAEKILKHITQPLELSSGISATLSGSIGVAFTTDLRISPEGMIDAADKAMYTAKSQGKNRIDIASHLENNQGQDAQTRIGRALAEDELRLYYQPIVELQTDTIIGFEALSRWQHPEEGLLSPMHFIDVISHSPLSLPFGQWLVHNAANTSALLWQHGFDVMIDINASQDQIESGSLNNALQQAARQHAPQALKLSIEILESTEFHELDIACSLLQEARDLGVQVALDDFGAGISSLTYASLLPLDTLKIDRSAIQHIDHRDSQRLLVSGIIQMAHAMNLRVVAEGVETQEQYEILREMGCDQAQGFWIGKPMPLDNLVERYITRPQPGDFALSPLKD
ncbi:EAL domain-containing protein [Vreelandella rituensis]|uniref:EAL domain-containing protein n=1 Tax=Vreelandella rituensis TaxID=2282306 RepID=A0A368U3M5_9GAMM|nr:EAL domain-containing protein [Halomonas rituensis]